MANKDATKKVFTVKALQVTVDGPDKSTNVSYMDVKSVGNGSFGTVYRVILQDTNEVVAIKKVLQSPLYRNRELTIMKTLEHTNIVKLFYYFFSKGEKESIYLHLILEYIPETIYRVVRQAKSLRQQIPIFFVKLYLYQLFRSLAYLHNKNICHRDIKSQNLLCNPATGVLKLCDFGCAKTLSPQETNVSYICSRYYRAPELLFNAVKYSCQIDVWSAGCIQSELLMGQPIFLGDTALNQLVEIIKILGTPTNEQILQMNPEYKQYTFPEIGTKPWNRVFRNCTCPDALSLISRLLVYEPTDRITALDALGHAFFDELRRPGTRMPGGQPLPRLFNFTDKEIAMKPEFFQRVLIPPHHSSSNGNKTAASSPPANDRESNGNNNATAPASSSLDEIA